MKLKLKTINKRCPNGELYQFVNGIAVVPGMWISKKPVHITIVEFNELCRAIQNNQNDEDDL